MIWMIVISEEKKKISCESNTYEYENEYEIGVQIMSNDKMRVQVRTLEADFIATWIWKRVKSID